MGDLEREESFSNARLRIARAKEHIVEFRIARDSFIKSDSCKTVIEFNDDRTQQALKIRLVKKIPDRLKVVAADVLNNLRSALDNATCAAAIASGVNSGRVDAPFPFGIDPSNFEIAMKRSRHLPPDIAGVIRSFKPYKTGNHILWAMNAACNTSKHQFLVPCQAAIVRTQFTAGNGYIESFAMPPPPTWDSRKQEIVVATMRPNNNFDCNLEVAIDIAFGKIAGIESTPASEFLDSAASEVGKVLTAIEDVTRERFPSAF